MRKALASLSLGLLLVALMGSGCGREVSTAVARSNQEAKRLYHVEPFREEHGQWRSERHQRIWDALTSTGGHDFTARVVFDERGDVVSADVRMLTHPASEPATNLNFLPGPDKQEKRLGIPEVMPK
jgi:hypothetical protein